MTDYSRTYTQEQLDIEILKEKSSRLEMTMERVERRLDAIDSTIKSQFSTTMNYIIGVYGLMLTSILAHIGGVF